MSEESKKDNDLAVSVDTAKDIVAPSVKTPEGGPESLSRKATIRKWFLYTIIGGLIITAIISIIAVLIGGINEIVGRSLGTTALMVFHSLVAVSLLSAATDSQRTKAGEITVNVLLGLTIYSFILSILSIWEVLTGPIVGDLYQLLFYALFADVLLYALLRSRFELDKYIALSAKVSIAITLVFFVYLLPQIFQESLSYTTPDIYNRGIAAFTILLSTSVVVTIIYHWVYALKHRDQLQQVRKEAIERGDIVEEHAREPLPLWARVILIVVAIIFGLPILVGLITAVTRSFI